MTKFPEVPSFSLLGGPLHRLGRRLGLVNEQGDTVKLGLVLGILPWLILLSLALVEGLGGPLFSLYVIGAHVRLLVLIPLLFVGESALAPRMANFVDGTLRARVVAEGSRPALESVIATINRWKDSWLLEALCLVAAMLLQPLAEQSAAMGVSMSRDPAHAIAIHSLTAWWWGNVCLILARFLVIRWFLRLFCWSYLLLRVSRMELNLLPSHPDGAGGLGGLDNVHREFLPMIVGFSSIVSASFAEELTAGTMAFAEMELVLSVMVVVVIVMFVGPVLVFAPRLKAARLKGAGEFRTLAARYSQQFETKWIGPSAPEEPLLGTPDIQSLADLANTVKTVREMRTVPVGRHLLTTYGVGVLLPFLPLLTFKYPVAALVTMLFKKLSGL